MTGTAPAGTTVTIAGGSSSVSGSAGTGGLFSLSVPLTPNQLNSLSVTATDSVGHVSPAVTTDLNGKTLAVQSDQVAPTVTATIPANGATGVTVGSAISVAFSKAINTGTANTLNVVLTTGGVAVAGAVSGSGTALTFTPAAPLTTGTQYQLTLRAGGVSDLAGNTLASAYIVSFATTAGTPTLTSVLPASGVVGSTFPVTFTGTTLSAASAVVSGNAGITGTLTAVGESTVTASITIAPSAAVGATTLGLLVGTTSLTVPFTVTAATPSVTAVSPAAGTAGNTLSVTFTGTNLAAAAKAVVSANAGITGTVTAASASSVTATIAIASTAAAGATTLGLTIGGANFSATFTVIAAAPSVASVSPASRCRWHHLPRDLYRHEPRRSHRGRLDQRRGHRNDHGHADQYQRDTLRSRLLPPRPPVTTSLGARDRRPDLLGEFRRQLGDADIDLDLAGGGYGGYARSR